MNIHEYQANNILRQYGIASPEGRVAFTVEDAVKAAGELSCEQYMVKAQIHAGGRGSVGGVKLAKNYKEVREYAESLLGKKLVTRQTGSNGKKVNCLLIQCAVQIKKEYYIGFAINTAESRIVIMASGEGGIDIEEVAERKPEKIFMEYIDPQIGLHGYQAVNLAEKIKLMPSNINTFVKYISGMYRLFVDKDCSIAEINPLVETVDGKLLALDAKVSFDSNALFRHGDILNLRDYDEEDSKEVEASQYGLSYISLDGNIGCMVNGAGLAMATMDIIRQYGGRPANFLDVGGGATAQKIAEALRIILSDIKVRGIMVNIFGGIMKCDEIAKGIVEASNRFDFKIPVVVRLEGTNAEQGKKILKESGINVISADSMSQAARKILEYTEQYKEVFV